MRTLLRDFRDFALKSNVVDLAVAVVIGVAFNAIITALVNDVVMPVVAAVFGKPNFDNVLVLTLNHAEIRFGAFLTVAVTFVSIAFVLFLMLKAYNKATGSKAEAPAPPDVAVLNAILDEVRGIRAASNPPGGN